MTPPEPSSQPEYDPTYLHSLRELVVILILFAVFCGWSILICGLLGYRNADGTDGSGEQIALVLGMPAWVFWGIFLPWIAVDVVAVWFCFFFMKVDDLEDSGSADSPRQSGTEPKESGNA